MDKSQKYIEVERYLKQKHDNTGGNCGTTPTELINALDTDYSLIKQALNALYKQGKITVCEGKDGKMVKLCIEKEKS